ncbi:MAG: Cro/Cl family transcriptional regulator [Gammaproteobacteria bacterium]|nr:Cro/Cl family transcriptional regulator [Gammaproteobacteria bacterium]MBU1834195.1 Cro/Cl family transcriptional regulator [Gammaproteobacteria bacterium]
MTPKQLIEHFGSRANAASNLGVTYEAVRQWDEAGEIPKTRQYQIEVVTKGQLKAGSSSDDTKAA